IKRREFRRTGPPDRSAFARAGAGGRDKRKSKHPENVFLPRLRQGVLLKTFSSATYRLAVAETYRAKDWGEFPDAASAMDAFSGWFDSSSLSRSAGSFGIRSPRQVDAVIFKLIHYRESHLAAYSG
ncbi:MAG TPA: hypothetical protein VGJ51_01895, partial [Candidatus Angelobacter sp.]